MPEANDPVTRRCPWCSALVTATDTNCHACGAALAQREDLGGVVIPGVTGVDPGLLAYDAQPTHLRGPSPTQGLATGIIPAAAMGGPAGFAIIGGVVAVAAAEYLSARGPGGAETDPKTVGELGGVAQLALERLRREEDGTAASPAESNAPAPATGTQAPEV